METGDEILLHYGGLLVQQPRSASALEAILRDYFDVPVKIEQFVGAGYVLATNTAHALVETMATIKSAWVLFSDRGFGISKLVLGSRSGRSTSRGFAIFSPQEGRLSPWSSSLDSCQAQSPILVTS